MGLPASTASPAVSVVEISDPAAAGAGIELIDQEVMQLQSKPLRARRVIVRLESAAVMFHSTNLRVRTRTSVREGLLGFVTFGRQAKGTVNGLPVRPGLLLVAEPGSEARFVADVGWESITFLLPQQDVRTHLAARRRESEFPVPQGMETLAVDAVKVRRLFSWGKRLVYTATRQPALFNERKNERVAAAVELLETLLATLRAASDFAPDRSDRTRQAHGLVVKVAEDYALSHTDDPVYVSDLCRVAAVSERTLEYAFKKVMGLAPITYLIRLRLHRVRQALRRLLTAQPPSRPRPSTGASGTSVNSRAPTRSASANCLRIRCDESQAKRSGKRMALPAEAAACVVLGDLL